MTTLSQKIPLKGTAHINYRPIMCIPMTRKILTAHIREEIYYSLISHGQFPEEQKGCHTRTRIRVLLYIDQHIPKDIKVRKNIVAKSRIDYKKACIIDYLKLYTITD